MRPYVDIREQVVDALLPLGYPVNGEYPAGSVTLPRIIYTQVSNTYNSPGMDLIRFQIDCYASSFEEAMDMAVEVHDVMTDMGFQRMYESPDSDARQDMGLYKKTFSFRAKVDIIMQRIL